jgi:hypothetical protein
MQQLAVQVAVVFAKVARSDYPRQWPALFGELLARAEGGSTLTVRRVYLVLHHTLKELASKRLAADQKAFAEVPASWSRTAPRPPWRHCMHARSCIVPLLCESNAGRDSLLSPRQAWE